MLCQHQRMFAVWGIGRLLTVLLLAGLSVLMSKAQDATVGKCFSQMEAAQFQALRVSANNLMRRAQIENDVRLKAFAHAFSAAVFTGTRSKEVAKAMESHLQTAKELAGRMGNDTVLSMAYNLEGILEAEMRGNNYLAKVCFIKAYRHARECHDERQAAKVALNLAKLGTRLNDATCAPYADEAFQWAQQHGKSQYAFLATQYKAFYLALNNDLASAATYIEKADSLLRLGGCTAEESFYNLQADIYTSLGRTDKAWVALRRIARQDGLAAPIRADYLYNVARLSQFGKAYTRSNEWLTRGLEAADLSAYGGERGRYLEMMAQNYEQMGDTARALMVQKELSRYNDSLRNSEKMMAVSQIEQAMQEKDSNKRTVVSLWPILLIAVVAVLLMGALLLHLRAKNGETIAKTAPRQERHTKVDEEKARHLFEQLQQLMDEGKAYADCNLTRDTLARQLGTNRTYLSQVIQGATRLSFNQFVNAYRVAEAKRILSDKTLADYPLKAICMDVGFKSRTTFDKLFTESEGLTPAEYRRQQLDAGLL